ncbi:MAG: glucose-1-phosphate adenylyltransferase [Halanaerobacter sp.]
MKTLALVLAGGRGTRLDILSKHRAKPGVPFAGKFRLIDFALSNCVNSGIYNVGVITQYLPMSLNKHIGIGKPWDLDRKVGGATVLQPFRGKAETGGWYTGTAHAVYKNMGYIRRHNPDQVVILSGDHVYEMDYSKMVDYHRKKDAQLTIAAQPVDYEEASRFGILDHNDEMQITEFVEKPEEPPSNLASMGIYVFETDILLEILEKRCDEESSDFGHHIIPPIIDNGRAFAYEFDDYWKDVGTLEAFWKTNLELTDPIPELNLYDEDWKLHTRSEEKPSVKFGENGGAQSSLVSNGSIINGKVENSVISPGVFIEDGAVVKDSIIFNDTTIRKNTVVDKAIIDKEVEIGENCEIGTGDDLTPNEEKPELLSNGLNVIAKRASIPANTTIARNCRVFSYVEKDDFNTGTVPSGSTITSESGVQIVEGDEDKVKELNI